MKNNIVITIVITIVIILVLTIATGLYLDFRSEKVGTPPQPKINIVATTTLTEDDYMDISIYIQDKEAARTSDCRITTKIEYTILKTTAVADASLRILFSDELLKYGVYKSVRIENGIAKVMLASPVGSLSSCESGHLLSVLKDTLIQYESIKSIELYSPEGKIEF